MVFALFIGNPLQTLAFGSFTAVDGLELESEGRTAFRGIRLDYILKPPSISKNAYPEEEKYILDRLGQASGKSSTPRLYSLRN